VRGDSVRDLYAKSLALLGLAVLAGAGALVDYWPVHNDFPAVSFSYSLPAVQVALDARAALASPLPVPAAPRPVPGPTVTATPTPEPVSVAPEMRVLTVPEDEPLAPPVAAPAPDVSATPNVAPPDTEPVLNAVELWASIPVGTAPTPDLKSSRVEPLAVQPSTNVLQKAGGTVLNAGFAVGTGVAKSFSAFGTAFSNIGKLFANK